MSLNDGATKRRHEMARTESWYLNASSRGKGVKNAEIVGTSMLSFDLGFDIACWLTGHVSSNKHFDLDTDCGPISDLQRLGRSLRSAVVLISP